MLKQYLKPLVLAYSLSTLAWFSMLLNWSYMLLSRVRLFWENVWATLIFRFLFLYTVALLSCYTCCCRANLRLWVLAISMTFYWSFCSCIHIENFGGVLKQRLSKRSVAVISSKQNWSLKEAVMLHQGVCTAALNKPNRIYSPGPFLYF